MEFPNSSAVEVSREKVVEYGGKARQKAMEMADARKSGVVASLKRFANSLEEAGGGDGGPERQVVETAAKYVRQAKDLLEQRSSDELLNMAVEGLRKRPGAIIVGMFGIGFLGARLLRT